MIDPIFERYKDALKQGHVAVLRGRPKDALSRYDEAARLADHRALPHLSMASVLLELGRAREALEAYERAAQRSPTELAAHRGRAAALRALGRRAEADAAESDIGRLEADSADSRARAEADTRAASRGQGVEELVTEAEESITLGDAEAATAKLVAAADGYLDEAAFDAALDVCQRALMVSPASPAIHLRMTTAYLARDQHDRAIERLVLLDRLLALEPDQAAQVSMVAICHDQRALDSRLAAIAVRGASTV